MRSIKTTVYTLFITTLVISTQKASAQLTGLQSIYFENQYLANPAMAGLDKGLNLNMGYQQQWTTIPGSPKLQDFTADYNSGNRVGLGFIVSSDQSGLISDTRIMGTYAYHLPVNEYHKLNFGLSFGLNDTYVDYNKINGDQGDVSVELFNQRTIYLDGDLGISYYGGGIDLQAVIPNIGSMLFNTEGTNLDVDRTTFYTAASYKLGAGPFNTIIAEPMVAYRGVKGFQNILDAGFNLLMPDYNFNVSAMYHTNESFTTGVGYELKPVRLIFSYTNNTGPLRYYANNTFEFGLKYTLLNQ